jgi:hypothetical protein
MFLFKFKFGAAILADGFDGNYVRLCPVLDVPGACAWKSKGSTAAIPSVLREIHEFKVRLGSILTGLRASLANCIRMLIAPSQLGVVFRTLHDAKASRSHISS